MLFEQRTIQAQKNQLRKTVRTILDSLPVAYIERASDGIQERVLSSPWYRAARSVFLYVSMDREPSTRLILRQALADGKRVYVPKCVSRREMLAVGIEDISQLAPGYLGILEPRNWTETAAAGELDLILVPCVCASTDGRRLGHGAGYYDRFLQASAEKTVCLCFHRLLREDIPTGENDVHMSAVVTENGVFTGFAGIESAF